MVSLHDINSNIIHPVSKNLADFLKFEYRQFITLLTNPENPGYVGLVIYAIGQLAQTLIILNKDNYDSK